MSVEIVTKPVPLRYEYDVLLLADVYAVISYYLEHQRDIDAYLKIRHSQREKIRQEIESYHSPDGIRQRLLARHRADCMVAW